MFTDILHIFSNISEVRNMLGLETYFLFKILVKCIIVHCIVMKFLHFLVDADLKYEVICLWKLAIRHSYILFLI